MAGDWQNRARRAAALLVATGLALDVPATNGTPRRAAESGHLPEEVGCNFPSNVEPKLWENFTQENMEDAFTKIASERRGFALI